MVHPVLVYCYWIFTASKFMYECWLDRCCKAVIFAQSGAVSVGPCPSSVNDFQCVFLLYDTVVIICLVRNVFTLKILISVKNND